MMDFMLSDASLKLLTNSSLNESTRVNLFDGLFVFDCEKLHLIFVAKWLNGKRSCYNEEEYMINLDLIH